MVQIVENRAEIAGTLVDTAPAPDRPGFVTLTVQVDATHAVGEWPNLFERDVGKRVEVYARAGSDVARSKPGPLRLRVRKAGPSTVFAE